MSEIIDALNQLEKEKGISKDLIMDAIEKSIVSACTEDFGDADFEVSMDRATGELTVFQRKTVVEDGAVGNPALEIPLSKAKAMNIDNQTGDVINIEVRSKEFGRIAAQKARSIIVQAIKEGERNAVFEQFACKERDIITGVVRRFIGNNISISLDEKTDVVLNENEQAPGEYYNVGDRIKLYVVEVRKQTKGFRILVSRKHPELVKRLFEKEVSEVADGTVEIKSVAREAGSRSKIAVWSSDENVDPVGACVGLNGTRVNNVVEDLKGEKIDIITWDENPEKYIENALSPSKVISVKLDEDGKSARVVVPDYQLSLAIGKEGQNARLAAKLTGFKIDIKSESQAKELGIEVGSQNDYDDESDGYSDEEPDYYDLYNGDNGDDADVIYER